MSRKTKHFEAFGVSYVTRQFSAVRGAEILKGISTVSPFEFLEDTCAIFDGIEYSLSIPQNIDKYVVDIIADMAPRLVLEGIISIVSDHNFGFLESWRPVLVPNRFKSNVDSVQSSAADPVIAQIVQSGSASIKELEEYYSLFDAFSMIDIMTAKGVNEATAQEAAMEEAKNKS